MTALKCDICGGKLVMGAGSIAVCDSCGMEHSQDRMKEKVQEIKGSVEVSNIAGVESLMKRGWLALEDGDWEQADEYFGKVLDINAEYAPAYIGKLCATLRIKKEDELVEYPIAENKDYQKALRFADASYHAVLSGYNLTDEARTNNALEILRQYIANRPKTQQELDYEDAVIKYQHTKANQEIAAKREYEELTAKREADIKTKQEQYQAAMSQYQVALKNSQEVSVPVIK